MSTCGMLAIDLLISAQFTMGLIGAIHGTVDAEYIGRLPAATMRRYHLLVPLWPIGYYTAYLLTAAIRGASWPRLRAVGRWLNAPLRGEDRR